MSYEDKPDPPNAVQIEPTEGCNLRCTFCGLQGIREKAGGPYKFMTPEVAGVVAMRLRDAGWSPRIELAMHGEPTLNPDLPYIAALFREALPKASIMLTTNGGGLIKGRGAAANLQELFDAGVNIIALDAYEAVNIAPKVRASLAKAGATVNYPVYEYPEESEGNPHIRANPKSRMLSIIRDISLPDVTTGTHAKLNNHCGAGAPLNDAGMGKRCAKPFRELSVRWDGSVALCCNDWRGKFKVGNLLTTTAEELWANEHFKAARRALYHGQRDFGACRGCDATSYRVGLLPDRMGREALPEPTPADRAAIAAATDGDAYTKPVLRPWELPVLNT